MACVVESRQLVTMEAESISPGSHPVQHDRCGGDGEE
jgi:hypothetical protein